MSPVKKLEEIGKKHSYFSKKRLISLFVLVFLVGVILQIWVSNRLATYGDQLVKLDQLKSSLSLQNELLQDDIAKWESLGRTEKYAERLGFKKITDIKYIQSASGSALIY